MTNQNRKDLARAQNYSRRSPLQRMLTILGGLSASPYPETGFEAINCNLPEADFWLGRT